MHPMPTLKPVAATASKQSQSMQYDMFCDASRVCSRGLRAPQLRVPSVSRAFRGARLPAPSYSFGDGSHTTFYQPVTAGSSKPKQLRKRIKQQQKRLKELSHGISSTDISPASIHTLLTEMREMNDNLAAVTKLASFSADISESDSDSETKEDKQKRKNRARSPSFDALSALTDVGGAAPPPAAALTATAQNQLDSLLQSPPSPVDPFSESETEAQISGSGWTCVQGVENNVVPRPSVPAARIAICQGSSCCKSGAAALLQQTSAAAAGARDIAVAPSKCLGKCKQGPVARVRVGRAKPDLLTHAAADDGGAIAHFIQQQQRLQQLQQAVEQQDLASVF